ncbi:Hexose transporter [Mycena venus]|uniref:Hexose transporter n=1 Tax=Mycena venus TaxID=2733690 RepID=A0A8H6X516_9AGAR|nr:Hexose transporter [Mycena venus]
MIPRFQFESKSAIHLDHTVTGPIGWKSFLACLGSCKRVRIIVAIAFFLQWPGNGLVLFYLNKVLAAVGIVDLTIQVCLPYVPLPIKPTLNDDSDQLLINGILSLWNFA